MGKIGVGIIGAGWVAGEHIKAYQKNPNTEVLGVASRRFETASSMASTFKIKNVFKTYQELLENKNIEIVSICSPNYAHFQQTIDSVRAGKNVLLEKPMCTTAEEARTIANEVKKAGVKLMVGHVARFVPQFQALREMADKGMFGDFFYGEGDYLHYLEPHLKIWEWGKFTKYSRGMFLAGGTHVVDLLIWFLGDVDEVFGYSGNYVRKEITNEGDKETPLRNEDTAVALFRFKKGGIGKASCIVGGKRPYKFHISLYGTKGFYEDGVFYTDDIPGLTVKGGIEHVLKHPAPGLEHWEVKYHPFQTEINHLVESIIKDVQPISNVDDGVRVMEAIDGFYRSIAEHKWIKVSR